MAEANPPARSAAADQLAGRRPGRSVAAVLDHLREAASCHDRADPVAHLLGGGPAPDRDAEAT